MFGAKAGRSSLSFSRKEMFQESGGPRKLECSRTWSIVPLPKPPSKDEENKVQMGRGRAGNFLLGFPVAVSVHPHQEKVCWSKAKPEVAFGDMLQCNPKVVGDEGQRGRGPEPLLNPI